MTVQKNVISFPQRKIEEKVGEEDDFYTKDCIPTFSSYIIHPTYMYGIFVPITGHNISRTNTPYKETHRPELLNAATHKQLGIKSPTDGFLPYTHYSYGEWRD